MSESQVTVLLLETSVQIDRRKMAGRTDVLDEMIQQFSQTVVTGISLVEFKAVLIQQLITIHNQMRRKGARFTWARDSLCEKQHPQKALRVHIFNNMVGIYGSSFSTSSEDDQEMAQKCCLLIENIVDEAYIWFREESATTYLNSSRINCTRAEESPVKDGKGYDSNLPTCVYGKNRNCRVEDFIRDEGASLFAHLKTVDESSEAARLENSQLLKARDIFERVFSDPKARLSVSDCRGAGDCLISLEAKGIATDAASTNAREWKHVSAWSNMRFVHVTYPEERTR